MQAHRESTGTVTMTDDLIIEDPVAAAEEMAFCRACARFGLGLYMYHESQGMYTSSVLTFFLVDAFM